MVNIEMANYDIAIEVNNKVRITLDNNYKGKLTLPVLYKGQQGELRIPVELEETDVENFKKFGFEVYEHAGIVMDFSEDMK